MKNTHALRTLFNLLVRIYLYIIFIVLSCLGQQLLHKFDDLLKCYFYGQNSLKWLYLRGFWTRCYISTIVDTYETTVKETNIVTEMDHLWQCSYMTTSPGLPHTIYTHTHSFISSLSLGSLLAAFSFSIGIFLWNWHSCLKQKLLFKESPS